MNSVTEGINVVPSATSGEIQSMITPRPNEFILEMQVTYGHGRFIANDPGGSEKNFAKPPKRPCRGSYA
ncbi:MAG: hypothetical protein LBI34_03825 [Puniceicoccales bacterium]|jgi:hypothetical protein|nr:hypothetical protein [Puniceicoccales bacterium]